MSFETEKAPLEVIDYGVDWTEELASNPGDAIASSSWSIDDPAEDDLILGTDYVEGNIAFCRTSEGGRLELVHYLVNRIVTASGQTWQRTIEITMREK